jgi:hypothetical protein
MPHIMFVSFNSNTTGASSEAIINYDPDELSRGSCVIGVTQSLVFCVL